MTYSTDRKVNTETVDLTTARDPVDTSVNNLARQVAQMNDAGEVDPLGGQAKPGMSTIRRAPIYDDARLSDTRATAVEQPVYDDPGALDLSDPDSQDLDLGDFLTPQELQQQQPPQPEVPTTPPGYEQFSKDFETYLGMPLADAVQTFQELQRSQIESRVERQLNEVRDYWGVNAEEARSRVAQVQERYAKLPPQTQAILAQDQVKATQLIWQRLEQEAAAKQTPSLDRSRVNGRVNALPKGALLKSDIARMSDVEYRQRQPEILEAYRRGLVFDQ